MNEKAFFRISSIERDAQYNRINIDKISKAIPLQSSEIGGKSEHKDEWKKKKLIKNFSF